MKGGEIILIADVPQSSKLIQKGTKMAKIIIDIPDDVYKSCRKWRNSLHNDNSFHYTTMFAIGHGTPLDDIEILKHRSYLEGFHKAYQIYDKLFDDIKAEIDEYKHSQLSMSIGIEDLEFGKQIAIEYIESIIDKHISGKDSE